MRVLYLLRYYPCLTESFVREELRALAARPGIDPVVVSMGMRADADLLPPSAHPEVPVWSLPRRPLERFLPGRRPSAGERFLREHQRRRDAARLPWLRARISQASPSVDRIHVHFAGEAAELAHALWLDLGVPYTVMVHAVDLFKPRASLPQVLGAAETVLTVCDHHRAVLDEQGVPARVLRCGPRLADWTGLPPPPPGPLRALFVGRNVPKKGLDTLLSAWPPRDPDAQLLVISELDSPVPPGVRILPPGPPAAVRAAMAWANLVVLPCRVAPDGDRDGVPLVLMEAIAAGRPVLSTAVAGIPELVGPEVGWLGEPDQPAALRALLDAADPPARRARCPGPGWLEERGFTLAAQVDGLCRAWTP